MRNIAFISIVLISVACTSLTTTTGYSGVNYGDSYKKVLEKLTGDERVVEESEDRIVAIVLWEVTGDCRKMVFKFSEGSGCNKSPLSLRQIIQWKMDVSSAYNISFKFACCAHRPRAAHALIEHHFN